MEILHFRYSWYIEHEITKHILTASNYQAARADLSANSKNQEVLVALTVAYSLQHTAPKEVRMSP